MNKYFIDETEYNNLADFSTHISVVQVTIDLMVANSAAVVDSGLRDQIYDLCEAWENLQTEYDSTVMRHLALPRLKEQRLELMQQIYEVDNEN